MTTTNPDDDAWTDSAPQGEDPQQSRDGGDSGGFEPSASFKVVTPPEGVSAAVTREEIERQTAQMAAREDTPSHIDYGVLDRASGRDRSSESTNDGADAADRAASDNDRDEHAGDDHDQREDSRQDQDHRLSEQDQHEAAGSHRLGADNGAAEVEGDRSLGADSGVEDDSSDHSLGNGDDDPDHGLSGAHPAADQEAGDHGFGGDRVEDERESHSLGGDNPPERRQEGSGDQSSSAQPRSESSPPLYRESESADTDTSKAGYAAAAAGGATAGYASRGQDSTHEDSDGPRSHTEDSDTAVTPAASPVTPEPPPPAQDRAQQRADRDHALGKREKQEGAEEQAPVKPKPTTDKFFGSLGLFLLRLALAAVIGIYGIQKVRNVEGVQAMLTSTALRDVVPENFMLLLAWALAIGELAIAAGLLFGFLTRIAGFGAFLVGVGALVLVHWLTNPISLEPGAGFPGSLELLIAAGGLLFLFLGAGRWSIDGAIRSARAAKRAAQR